MHDVFANDLPCHMSCVINGLQQSLNYYTSGPVGTEMRDHLLPDKPHRYVTSHPDQLSLLPSAGLEVIIGQGAVMLCAAGSEGRMAHSTCG